MNKSHTPKTPNSEDLNNKVSKHAETTKWNEMKIKKKTNRVIGMNG